MKLGETSVVNMMVSRSKAVYLIGQGMTEVNRMVYLIVGQRHSRIPQPAVAVQSGSGTP